MKANMQFQCQSFNTRGFSQLKIEKKIEGLFLDVRRNIPQKSLFCLPYKLHKLENRKDPLPAVSCRKAISRRPYKMNSYFDYCGFFPFNVTKVIEMFGSLLERPIISKYFGEKYATLVAMVSEDLDTTKKIFDDHQSAMQEPEENSGEYTPQKTSLVDKNMPPIAGLLKWSQELRERIQGPVQLLQRRASPG